MNQTNAANQESIQPRKPRLGPRGWAMLTLAGGAALSSPFLRPAELKVPVGEPALRYEVTSETTLASTPFAASGNAAWPLDPAQRDAQPSQTLHATPRQLGSERLPSTDPTPRQWPDWVKPTTRLDRMIAEGAVHAPSPARQDWEPNRSSLPARDPWVADGTSPSLHANATAPMQSVASSVAQRESNWSMASPFRSSAVDSAAIDSGTGHPDGNRSRWPQADPSKLRGLANRDSHSEFPSGQGTFLPASIAGGSRNATNRSVAPRQPGSNLQSATSGSRQQPATAPPGNQAKREKQFVYQPGLQQ